MCKLHFMYAFAICMMFFSSCSEEESTTIESDGENKADVSLSITTADGRPVDFGTSDKPIIVANDEALNLTIAQKSHYTDFDGTIYECTPKAAIAVSAKQATVYAENVKELTKMIGQPEIRTTVGQGNPQAYKTVQNFNIGGKIIEFGLEYEVYTHTNKAGQKIEMPYIKLNPAQLGTAQSAQKPTIKLKRMDLTRTVTVSDTTMFEVSANFEMQLAAINSTNQQTQSLNFEVKYIAGVTQAVELPDPTNTLSFSVESSEDALTATYTKPLTIKIDEKSQHITSFGEVFEHMLWASVNVTLSNDTVFIMSKQELDNLVPIEEIKPFEEAKDLAGDNNTVSLGTQNISIETRYQIPAPNDDYNIAYLAVESPWFVQIESITPLNGSAEAYKVRARFAFKVTSVNSAEPVEQKIEFFVEYVAKVKNPELLKVIYRQNYVWEAPHDNITWNFQLFVYRDKYYTDGTMVTDTIPSPRYMEAVGCGIAYFDSFSTNKRGFSDGEAVLGNNEVIISARRSDRSIDDYIEVYGDIGVDDLDLLSFEVLNRKDFFSTSKNWSELTIDDYRLKTSFPQEANVPEPLEASNQGFKTTDLPNGWYFCQGFILVDPAHVDCIYNRKYEIYTINQGVSFSLLTLVLDHKIIQFDEWLPKDIVSTFSIDAYNEPFNKAKEGTEKKIVKLVYSAVYLGHTFGKYNQTILYIKK